MVYGLRADDLSMQLINKTDTYMYMHLRMVMRPRWNPDEWYTERKQMRQTLQQSTMESWINQTRVATMIAQTQETMTAQPLEFGEMMLPKLKLRDQ